MVKHTYLKYAGTAVLALSLVAGNVALAEDTNNSNDVQNVNETRDVNEIRNLNENRNSNEVENDNENENSNEAENGNEIKNINIEQGKSMREEHASEVSKFVQSLLDIAGRDQNIGKEVSDVAQAQNDQAAEDDQAINAVETRGAFKTFLIGTDYKNIGVIRSGMVTTQNSISRLTAAMAKATDPQVKADLQTQIDALKASQLKLDEFVRTNESKFSLLGWLVRMFY